MKFDEKKDWESLVKKTKEWFSEFDRLNVVDPPGNWQNSVDRNQLYTTKLSNVGAALIDVLMPEYRRAKKKALAQAKKPAPAKKRRQ